MSDVNNETNNDAEESEIVENEPASNDQPSKKTHKHDSGLADLEKVTDYVEEKELSSHLSQAITNLLGDTKSQDKSKDASKLIIRKEDVELIMNEMEVSKIIAEKELRKHRGNVKEALKSMLVV